MNRATVLVAVVLLVTSAIAPVVASPSGMVTLPDSNVHENYASGGPPDGLPGVQAFRGSVMAGKHADTLELTVTTGDRVAGPDGEPVGRAGELALIFADDVHHEGRRVAVPAAALRQAFGHVPEAAHGLHESGTTWTAPIEQSGQLAVFRVPKFSSNTVTFTGEINATGTYTDGSRITYDLADLDAVDSFTINVTGHNATEWDNETGRVEANTTAATAFDGTVLRGPSANGKPVLEVTVPQYQEVGEYQAHDVSNELVGKDSGGSWERSDLRVENPPKVIRKIMINVADNDESNPIDIYIKEGEGPDTDIPEGTLVKDDWTPPTGGGNYTIDITDYTVSDENLTGPLTVSFNAGGSYSVGAFMHVKADDQGKSKTYHVHEDDPETWNHYKDVPAVWLVAGYKNATDVEAADDQGTTETFGDLSSGETVTREFPVTTNTSELTFNLTNGGFDYTLRVEEVTETTDPEVCVNENDGGNCTAYTGTLADGETVSLAANESWVQEGTNNVNVTVGDGSLSADAPTPQFDLEYRHGARDDQSVTYDAEMWSERYNISRTWSAEQENAQLEIPFAGNVVAIRTIEKRVNGSSWTTVSESDYSLSGTDLTVELGTAQVNETIEVRAVGSKVQVHNGAIEVLEPTTMGATLDTKFEITSWSLDAYIDVSGTPDGDRLHYTTTESWSDPSEYAIYTAGGGQHLFLPNAGAGQTARVTTIPLGVIMHSGDAKLWVTDPDEPVFEVRPGPDSLNDKVELRYYDVTEGESYELYSRDEESPLTTNEAGPTYVAFMEDDLEDTLLIQLAGSSGGDDSGGSGGSWEQAARNTPIENLATIGGLGVLVVMLVYGTGQAGIAGRSRWGLVGSTLVAGVVVSLELLRPGAISEQVGAALGEVTPIAGLAAVGVVTYSVVTWWQARKQEAATPETEVSFNLGGGKGD